MANLGSETPAGDAASHLIDGHFAIDFDTPLASAGGGQPAFAAHSTRAGSGFMAVQAAFGMPVRARLLSALIGSPIPNVLVPLAHGTAPMPSGEIGYFVMCPAPPGRPLSADLRPWSEQELLDLLLRPVAVALADLHGQEATHRAIRPNNLFRAGLADLVILGSAWAAPPASRQPCVYEPPYSALCLPAGRGDGARADDIYALGVLLIALALGRDPLEGMDDETIIRAKLDRGSYDAIVGHARLPTAVAELARGMLADDPEHRPSAVLLGDPGAARARRAAARPQRRGQRVFPLGESQANTTRELALAITARPDQAAAQLRNGAVGTWLRRSIGDGTMAGRIDDICHLRDEASTSEEPRADSLLATRAIAVLDPLAPLSWRGLTLWPDALGPALNHALNTDPAQAVALTELATDEVALSFGQLRPERSDIAGLRTEARFIRTCVGARPPEQATLRLNYALNALAPCESPLVAGRWVARLSDLLPALEIVAAGPLRTKLPPLDRHIVAFIGIRRDERTQSDLGPLSNLATPGDAMSQLRLLARLQQYTHPEKLPALTAWMAEIVAPATAKFHSQSHRKRLAVQVAEMAKGGWLAPLAVLLDDPAGAASDDNGQQAAIARGAEIDAELRNIEATMEPRRLAAVAVAQNITTGISLAACGLALAASVFL
jgi:hypothetical protein